MTWATHLIEKLDCGERVSFRPRGNSMEPRVRDGQPVTVAPVTERPPALGDVVLCTVRGRRYFHLVSAVDGDRFQISNNRGHINGWTRRVHGVMVP